ncbi:MAG: TIM barrel protein [Phycisphaerales bacterium]|nr:TIM barrel protein [Phycisphaerales bacterium]
MDRRDLLKSAVMMGGAVLAGGKAIMAENTPPQTRFKLKYAIQSDWFMKLPAMEDWMQRIHDAGFRAVENNLVRTLQPDELRRYAHKLEQLGLAHGIFLVNRGVDAGAGVVNSKEHVAFIEEVHATIETAKVLGNKHVTITTGNELPGMTRGQMTANVIEGLKRGGELLAKAGLIGVVEPLNVKVNHPGYFCVYSDEAYAIMKAVDNPHIKILFDIYHQQISEGNLIDNIRRCWDEIGYFQFADVPGRHEPWTGEINYRNVFKAIHDKQRETGQDHFVGAELTPQKGNTPEGMQALFEAIRRADDFEI